MDEMEVVAWRIYDAVTDAKSLADEYEKDGWLVEPLVTLTSAQAEIERLASERDEARRGEHAANEYEPTWSELVAAWKARAEAAEKERDALREALKLCEQVLMRYEINRVDGEEIADATLQKIRSALQPLEPKND